jgi:hypothetical protein
VYDIFPERNPHRTEYFAQKEPKKRFACYDRLDGLYELDRPDL